MHKNNLNKIIKDKATELGFNYIGFSPAQDIDDNLEKWINLKYHASMSWMNTTKDKRNNIFNYFPEVKTIISFAYNYYTESNDNKNSDYKISNYAWGNDYHIILKEKLYEIIKIINSYNKKYNYRVCVDTSPLMEKYWAQRAGLGWIGKHTNLINSKIGSWFFLSEIIIDFKLEYNKPFMYDLCGSCTKCIEACPTDAIVFGDMNDKESKVSINLDNERNFHVIEEVHTLPSVGYLTKVRNVKKKELKA